MAKIFDKLPENTSQITPSSFESTFDNSDANEVYLQGCKKILESQRAKLLTETNPDTIVEINRIISLNESEIKRLNNPRLKLIQLREDLEDALSQIDNEEKRLNINIANGAIVDLDYLTNQSNIVAEIAQKIKDIESN
jgi:hypothetical protein